MKISIIVAVDEKNGIGKDGKIPWHIPEDLKRFKEITTNHPLIMGRKTFESIGKSLPNRTNIVITRNKDFKAKDCLISTSLEKAIKLGKKMPGGEEVFIIGGGQIFNQAISMVNKLYLTKVKGVYDADTFFPDYSMFKKITFQEDKFGDGYQFQYLNLEK